MSFESVSISVTMHETVLVAPPPPPHHHRYCITPYHVLKRYGFVGPRPIPIFGNMGLMSKEVSARCSLLNLVDCYYHQSAYMHSIPISVLTIVETTPFYCSFSDPTLCEGKGVWCIWMLSFVCRWSLVAWFAIV